MVRWAVAVCLVCSCGDNLEIAEPDAGAEVEAPSVFAIGPVGGSVDVSPAIFVVVTFDEAMDEALTEAAFTLRAGATATRGSFAWSGQTLTFTPSEPLAVDTEYTARVDVGARSARGGAIAAAVEASFTTGSAAAAPLELVNEIQTLQEAETDSRWVGVGGGGTANSEVVGDFLLTRSDLDLLDRDWAIEAVLSSVLPAASTEAGARIIARNPSDTAAPLEREIQVRLQRAAQDADNFIAVTDAAGNIRGQLLVAWDATAPRIRVRLMRQGDEILLQTEPSDVFEDDLSSMSISVPFDEATFPVQAASAQGVSELEFGNAAIAAPQNSTWESLHVTASTTGQITLPYRPPTPPAPILLLGDRGAGSLHDVVLSGYSAGRPYLASDAVTAALDNSVGDPIVGPGDDLWTFEDLEAGRAVAASLVVTEVSGRSTPGPVTMLTLPPR